MELSYHDLRKKVFAIPGIDKTKVLRMKIPELQQALETVKAPEPPPPEPVTLIPRRTHLYEILKDYVDMGLKIDIQARRWYMEFNGKTDEGGMDVPFRVIRQCAARIMK